MKNRLNFSDTDVPITKIDNGPKKHQEYCYNMTQTIKRIKSINNNQSTDY